MKTETTPRPKVTRQEVAKHTSLSLRTIDNLTRKGILPFYRIGKSVRFELEEVDAALRARFHVNAKK